MFRMSIIEIMSYEEIIFVLFKKQASTRQSCIIRFKNLRQRREFLPLIIHDCEFVEWLQNLSYRLTHSCTNILDLGLFWHNKLEVKFSHGLIRYKDTH